VGRLALLPQRALTSARRWESRGIVRGTLTNLWCLTLYALGRSPERLLRLYSTRSKRIVSEP
jgi:hypothetical protein